MRDDIVRNKIKEIEECITSVKENIPDNFEEFKHLGLVKDGIYKRMEFAVENVFDICAVINSDLDLGIPEGDESIVDNLIKEGVFEIEWKERLSKMKAFRNIVVHRYGKINDRIAYDILTDNLDDFYDFIEEVERFIEK